MKDEEERFEGMQRRKPYPSARKLARKRDSWEEKRGRKKGKKS